MNGRERITLQRVVFVIAACLALLILTVLCSFYRRGANQETNDTASLMSGSAPSHKVGTVEDPGISYHSITLTYGGVCTTGSMLGSSSYGTFNSMYAEDQASYFFRRLHHVFSADTMTLVGCNAVFSDSEDLIPAEKAGYEWHLAPGNTAALFAEGSVDAVSLECSGVRDYGTAGYGDTKAALEASGVLWGDTGKALYVEDGGVRVANYFCRTGDSYRDGVLTWISNARAKNDYIVLYVYVDEKEGSGDFLRSLIDAGADLVVGTNPAAPAPVEVYGDGMIVHSLGSLIDGSTKYPNRYTVLLRVEIRTDGQEIFEIIPTLIPCVTYDEGNSWCPAVIEDEGLKKQVLAYMNGERETIE